MEQSIRYSLSSLAKGENDAQGKLFANDLGITDLSNVEIVGSSIDTVRQLFHGLPNSDMVKLLESHAESHDDVITLPQSTIFPGVWSPHKRWHFSRMGKVSRYRFKLQDNEEGIVILFGSYFEQMDKSGQHLKIELSPHFISRLSVFQIWERLHHAKHGLSVAFLNNAVPSGCATHLAVDYQGFDLPLDFLDKFSTRSKTFRSYDGLNELDLSDLSESIATYGGSHLGRNYLIGKAASIQLCSYDKGYEIIKSDKQDYFHDQWGKQSQGLFNPDKPVRRLEIRLHHQVIREIGEGIGKPLESFIDVVRHLTDIWRFALSKNRLHLDTDKKILHPFWQLLMEDVSFYAALQGSLGQPITRKKKQAVSPISKNIGLVLGNMMTIYARQQMSVKAVMRQLRTLTFYPDIVSYYESRHLTESDLREYVEKSLCLRRLIGKAA
jgi:hypothetical protein